MQGRCILRWLWLFVALTPMASFAASEEAWLDTRGLSQASLDGHVAPESSHPVATQTRALLTLAEQSLNRSTEDAATYLKRAEALIASDPDAAAIALAIRCQLEHRQSLPTAAATCGKLQALDTPTDNLFVQALQHVTLMYFFYREGDHPRSLSEAERAMRLALAIDDPALLAATHNVLGLHFATKLLPRMSLPHFESALDNARRLPFTEPLTITQLNLASSYTYLGRAREALDMLLEAQTEPLVSLYDTRRLVVQSMIGQARAAIGDTEGEAETLQRVIDDVADSVLPDGMTFGYTGLGIIQLADGNPREALATFQKVLDATGQNFETGLSHSRIQLVAVPYAEALRKSGDLASARELLLSVIALIPSDHPDQLLLDAYRELALTDQDAGDTIAAKRATDEATSIESRLWDASFQYQVARLNASLATDRRQYELKRSTERESALRQQANREITLRRQTWLIGAMLMAVIALLLSRRSQTRIAAAERTANARLEDQVKTRTRELETEMAKRMAVEVERRELSEQMAEGEKLRAMGQLTAGISHDFNNLMTVVTLGAGQLKKQLHGDTMATDTLEHIIGAADTGARITRGLLAYVRKQPLKPQVLQLNEFLDDALPIWRNTLGERIALTTRFEPCQSPVDQSQLTTAMLNLLLNAKEAMPTGGTVSITLTTDNEQAKIAVTDNGTGMSQEVVQRAVDPFFTTKVHGEGSGLGLSMVYGFARQSGGDLHIKSTPHKGTTITLSLPVATQQSQSNTPAGAASHRIPTDTHLLAVEDRAQLLLVLEPALVQLGLRVTTASNADDALGKIETHGLPDLVITDIVMPGSLDGLGLVAELRRRSPDLPVVLMSGYSKSVDEECTFLRKPFSVTELETAIEQTLCRHQSSAETT
ncbi:MAG: ATP-binding protein [Gammaproteobacteria bacterium]